MIPSLANCHGSVKTYNREVEGTKQAYELRLRSVVANKEIRSCGCRRVNTLLVLLFRGSTVCA